MVAVLVEAATSPIASASTSRANDRRSPASSQFFVGIHRGVIEQRHVVPTSSCTTNSTGLPVDEDVDGGSGQDARRRVIVVGTGSPARSSIKVGDVMQSFDGVALADKEASPP